MTSPRSECSQIFIGIGTKFTGISERWKILFDRFVITLFPHFFTYLVLYCWALTTSKIMDTPISANAPKRFIVVPLLVYYAGVDFFRFRKFVFLSLPIIWCCSVLVNTKQKTNFNVQYQIMTKRLRCLFVPKPKVCTQNSIERFFLFRQSCFSYSRFCLRRI